MIKNNATIGKGCSPKTDKAKDKTPSRVSSSYFLSGTKKVNIDIDGTSDTIEIKYSRTTTEGKEQIFDRVVDYLIDHVKTSEQADKLLKVLSTINDINLIRNLSPTRGEEILQDIDDDLDFLLEHHITELIITKNRNESNQNEKEFSNYENIKHNIDKVLTEEITNVQKMFDAFKCGLFKLAKHRTINTNKPTDNIISITDFLKQLKAKLPKQSQFINHYNGENTTIDHEYSKIESSVRRYFKDELQAKSIKSMQIIKNELDFSHNKDNKNYYYDCVRKTEKRWNNFVSSDSGYNAILKNLGLLRDFFSDLPSSSNLSILTTWLEKKCNNSKFSNILGILNSMLGNDVTGVWHDAEKLKNKLTYIKEKVDYVEEDSELNNVSKKNEKIDIKNFGVPNLSEQTLENIADSILDVVTCKTQDDLMKKTFGNSKQKRRVDFNNAKHDGFNVGGLIPISNSNSDQIKEDDFRIFLENVIQALRIELDQNPKSEDGQMERKLSIASFAEMLTPGAKNMDLDETNLKSLLFSAEFIYQHRSSQYGFTKEMQENLIVMVMKKLNNPTQEIKKLVSERISKLSFYLSDPNRRIYGDVIMDQYSEDPKKRRAAKKFINKYDGYIYQQKLKFAVLMDKLKLRWGDGHNNNSMTDMKDGFWCAIDFGFFVKFLPDLLPDSSDSDSDAESTTKMLSTTIHNSDELSKSIKSVKVSDGSVGNLRVATVGQVAPFHSVQKNPLVNTFEGAGRTLRDETDNIKWSGDRLNFENGNVSKKEFSAAAYNLYYYCKQENKTIEEKFAFIDLEVSRLKALSNERDFTKIKL